MTNKAIQEAANADMERYRWQQTSFIEKTKIILSKLGLLGRG